MNSSSNVNNNNNNNNVNLYANKILFYVAKNCFQNDAAGEAL